MSHPLSQPSIGSAELVAIVRVSLLGGRRVNCLTSGFIQPLTKGQILAAMRTKRMRKELQTLKDPVIQCRESRAAILSKERKIPFRGTSTR